jgi:hypothetical protein
MITDNRCEASYKNPVASVSFPELFGYAKFFAFKYPVEVGDIVEPAFISNFSYCAISINQHS